MLRLLFMAPVLVLMILVVACFGRKVAIGCPALDPITAGAIPIAAKATSVKAICVDERPRIDGNLNESVWALAQPLTYAVHPPSNDSTAVVVKLLWDKNDLFVGFDVSRDVYVEFYKTA